MNYSMIFFIIGWVFIIEAALMAPSALVAVLYSERSIWAFAAAIGLCLLLGVPLVRKQPANKVFYAKEGCVTVALSWIVMSLMGALPFVFSGVIPSIVDAMFETVSGFTTTGASILKDVEVLPRCMLFWRSFTHWIGGMGVLVFLLCLLPMSGGGYSMNLMKAESPGPSVSKLVPKVRSTAKLLYGLYVALSLLELALLLLGSMPLFDALCTTFGTAGTGGFGIKNSSIGEYSAYIQSIVTIFMILFGINFNVYFLLYMRKPKEALRCEEAGWYLAIIAVSTLIITVFIRNSFPDLVTAFRHAAFQVGSIITTTGFSTVDFNVWPAVPRAILVLLMFIGVLVRCDFNVPLKDGAITDETRIVAALPTIKKLMNDGGRVILCSHLGKVKNGPNEGESLAPVAKSLSEKLGKEVVFVSDYHVTGEAAAKAVEAMKDGDVILLQNTRFRGAEETKNGEGFSRELADLADDYVCDAFGSSHRAHASVAGVTKFITEKGGSNAVGYLMQKEIEFLGNAVENPVRPFVAILGGAKVADKLNVISNLLEKCDTLIIGGGMAYTFLKAQGKEIGNSLVDDSKLDYCKEMMEKAEKLGKKLLLPVDTTVVSAFPSPIDAPVDVEYVSTDAIPADKEGVDIGPETCKIYSDAVKNAKTVVWNGPMGVFENPTLAAGTIAVARALAETDATTIIGGGDSAAAVNQLGFGNKMTHISTGGGASLEFLEGKELPGVVAADDK